MADKLIGQNYTPPDLIAKVTGKARYAEDYRADGMLFCKLLLSPMPHARVIGIDTRDAMKMPGVKAILTADDLPDLAGAERALTNEPLYAGEPILAVAAVDELTAAERDRAHPRRPRAAAVCDRSDRKPPPGQSERAHRRQRVDTGAAWSRYHARRAGDRTAGTPSDPNDQMDGRRFCRRAARPHAPRESSGRMGVRRSRRRVQQRGASRRRNVCCAIYRSSPDGNAQRDGLLAKRQALPARLNAKRRPDRRRDPAAAWTDCSPTNSVDPLRASHCTRRRRKV